MDVAGRRLKELLEKELKLVKEMDGIVKAERAKKNLTYIGMIPNLEYRRSRIVADLGTVKPSHKL